MQFGCATPTLSIDWSSFTTSLELRMEEHKTMQSRGSSKYEEGGWGTKYMWQPMGFAEQYARQLREVMLGGCDSWTYVCAYSPTSLCSGGVFWRGDDGKSLVTATVSVCDCTTPSPKYVEQGLGLNFLFGLIDLVRQYSVYEILEFIWLFGAWNCNTQKRSENSICNSSKAFHCFNIFWSKGSRSKWWKLESMRSQNYSSECTVWGGKLQHHHSGDSQSVYTRSTLASCA